MHIHVNFKAMAIIVMISLLGLLLAYHNSDRSGPASAGAADGAEAATTRSSPAPLVICGSEENVPQTSRTSTILRVPCGIDTKY